MKIVSIVGARPNLMKIAPIIARMRDFPELESVLVHTGQHYDSNMSGVFFEELGIPAPDYNLGVGSGSHSRQTAQIMLELEPLFLDICPDLVIVVGDVNSTVAATLVAAKLHIPVAHVEAGLRSFDRTMPEEINRLVTDALADYLFTTEPAANENLRREGISDDKIFFVGNVMIDTLLSQRQRAAALQMPERFKLAPRSYGLLTMHRPGNVDNPHVLSGMFEVVSQLQQDLPVIFPIHPRTRKRLEETSLLTKFTELPHVLLTEPLSYLEFLGLMADARLVLTDSGGIQEETTILGVPCLTLRENTERPVTLTQGTNQLVGIEPAAIIAAARRVLATPQPPHQVPELWDGHAAERIVTILNRLARS